MDEFPYDGEELKRHPDQMLEIIKNLYQKVKFLESKLDEKSSKKADSRKGGSKKGKSGMTWSKKSPDLVIHNYVEACLHCNKPADKKEQKISYSKRIMEMPVPAKIELHEVHIHKYECEKCGNITQAAEPTLHGTSLGPKFLAFLTSARYRTGSSFESIAQIIEYNTGIKPSQTSLNRGLNKVCVILQEKADEIAIEIMNKDKISMSSKVINLGETNEICQNVFTHENSVYFSVSHAKAKIALKEAMKYRKSKVKINIMENRLNALDELMDNVKFYNTRSKTFRSDLAMKHYSSLLTVLTTWNMQKLPLVENLIDIIDLLINRPQLIKV